MTIHIPHINAIDPSRTLTLRNHWVSDFRRRFKLLIAVIKEAIVDQDVLGLNVENLNTERINIINATGLTPRQFDFQRDADKINSFTDWMQQQSELYLLSGGTQGLQITGSINQLSSENNWTNIYIDSAYQQGIKRGREELKKAGVNVGDIQSGLTNDPIQAAFNTPIHINRVGLVYTRSFSSLKAITASMDSVISDALAVGMAEGKGPREIAAAINKAISGKGEDFGILDSLGRFIPAQRRAEILARTEVMRSHHSANMGEYKAAGLLGIEIKAEYLTAGDGRVCPLCAPLNGKIFTIEKAESLIPVHPQCRCVALPYLPDEQDKKPVKAKKKKTKKEPTKAPAAVKETKAPTQKQLKSDWQKKDKELQDYLDLPFEQRQHKQVMELKQKERGAFYNYMDKAPDAQYKKQKNEIIEKLAGSDLTRVQKKNVEVGLNYVPIDVLDKLENDGVKIVFTNRNSSRHRAYYSTRHQELVLAKNSDPVTIAHEMGHAIDHMYGDYNDNLSDWKTMSNGLVTTKEGKSFKKWYKDTHSGEKATYSNGDGQFWTDNWIDDYEGRIYPTNRDGAEWWSMNIQRYSEYLYKKDISYTKEITGLKKVIQRNIERPLENSNEIVKEYTKILENMEKEGPEIYAKRRSSWKKVTERYPELAEFIEKKLGRRVSGDY